MRLATVFRGSMLEGTSLSAWTSPSTCHRRRDSDSNVWRKCGLKFPRQGTTFLGRHPPCTRPSWRAEDKQADAACVAAADLLRFPCNSDYCPHAAGLSLNTSSAKPAALWMSYWALHSPTLAPAMTLSPSLTCSAIRNARRVCTLLAICAGVVTTVALLQAIAFSGISLSPTSVVSLPSTILSASLQNPAPTDMIVPDAPSSSSHAAFEATALDPSVSTAVAAVPTAVAAASTVSEQAISSFSPDSPAEYISLLQRRLNRRQAKKPRQSLRRARPFLCRGMLWTRWVTRQGRSWLWMQLWIQSLIGANAARMRRAVSVFWFQTARPTW